MRSFISSLATSPAQLQELRRFRYNIYVQEMGKWLSTADHERRMLVDPLDADAEQFTCRTTAGELVGTTRLHTGAFVPLSERANLGVERFMATHGGPVAYMSKLMFASGARGRGAMLDLLSFAYRHVRQSGAVVGFIPCAPPARFPTWFFPVGEDFVAIVAGWKRELEQVHGFNADDPLFPQTEVAFGPGGEVLPPRLRRECWSNADPIRKVFKHACAAAGLPDFKPHSFRHTLAQLGSHLCKTPAEYKAWSQNLGHDGALVTLTSYGTLPAYMQRELLRGLSPANSETTA